MPPLLVYTVLRLLAFLVPLALMLLFLPIFRQYWWIAVIFATLIGLSLSMIFLRAPLSAASRSIFEKRASARNEVRDEHVEDAATR